MRMLICAAVLSATAFASAPAAASHIYMRATGEATGEIKGGVTRAGREDSMEIYGFSHEITSPRDAASGMATGKRQHKPLTVTMAIDKSTPVFLNALATNENLTKVRLQFYQPSRAGAEVQYYTIELTNASVVNAAFESADDARPRDGVTLSFTYQTITETSVNGGVTFSDTAQP